MKELLMSSAATSPREPVGSLLLVSHVPWLVLGLEGLTALLLPSLLRGSVVLLRELFLLALGGYALLLYITLSLMVLMYLGVDVVEELSND